MDIKKQQNVTQEEWEYADVCDSWCGTPCTPNGCPEDHPSGIFEFTAGGLESDPQLDYPRYTNEADMQMVCASVNAVKRLAVHLDVQPLELSKKLEDGGLVGLIQSLGHISGLTEGDWRDDTSIGDGLCAIKGTALAALSSLKEPTDD